jgi:hypothetical protein
MERKGRERKGLANCFLDHRLSRGTGDYVIAAADLILLLIN